jgi:hypothetical protein
MRFAITVLQKPPEIVWSNWMTSVAGFITKRFYFKKHHTEDAVMNIRAASD